MNEIVLSNNLPADQNPAATLLAQASTKNTRRAYERCLNNIAAIFESQIDTLDWRQLRHQHGMMVRARLIEVYESGATINQHLAALRGVFEQSWLLGNSIVQALTNVKESKLPAGRYIPEDEFKALMATCKDNSLLDVRDKAILSVFYVTGMRKQELINLNIGDFDLKQKSLTLRNTKTHEDRIVYVNGAALNNLNRWLKSRAWDSDNDPLFCSTDRNMSRLTPSAVDARLKSRAKEAGIETIGSHDFRRTWASNGFDNPNVDDATVVALGGWKDPKTAYRYDRRGERAKQRASEFIDIPQDSD
jgi:integrase